MLIGFVKVEEDGNSIKVHVKNLLFLNKIKYKLELYITLDEKEESKDNQIIENTDG